MTTSVRTVRHLRLGVPDEDSARRLLLRLEDALRCASLPDDDGRLLIVRRLALGRLDPDASPQALGRLLEERMAHASVQWVQGDTPAARDAAFVCFAGGLQACTRLALRLARREPFDEWYWPSAVPELREASDADDALRRIARTLAAAPEARAALPAWAAALVERGVGPRLASAIGAPEGVRLLRDAGLDVQGLDDELDDVEAAAAGSASPAVLARAAGRAASRNDVRLPAWLRRLAHAGAPARVTPRAPASARDRELAPEGSAASVEATTRTLPNARTEAAANEAQIDLGVPPRIESPVPGARPVPPPAAPEPSPDAPPEDVASWDVFLDVQPTARAGLLFLLPVLRRLGLQAWCAEAQDDRFACRVLRAALERLDAPQDDAAWAMVGSADPAPPHAVAAPDGWDDPALAAPKSSLRVDLREALATASSIDAQARVWLLAARRWLRRVGRLGLASLVLRPGAIHLTPTHVDVLFRLDDADMRVRRLGLDFDPGWLPWFGRVVNFQYRRDALAPRQPREEA